ncbi:MAG: DNA cytosine methyltransferase, partial [Candidatus Fonsibacter sp.]
MSTKRPRAFLLENVKGLVTQHRATFDDVFQQLRQIANGAYKVRYTIIDTARHGIPQHRERVYIAGLLRDYLVPGCFKLPEPCIFPGDVRSARMADRRQQAEYVRQGPPKREGLPCQRVAQGHNTFALDSQSFASEVHRSIWPALPRGGG